MRRRDFLLMTSALLALPGCRHATDDAVVVWSWDIAAAALRQLVPAFEERHPGVRVKVIDLGNGQVFERGMAGCAAGGVGLPDVYTLENNNAEAFWARFPQAFTDLVEFGARQLWADFPLFKWIELTRGDNIFAVPWDAGPVVVFYRRDLYARAGVDPDQIQTWDDFLQAGKKMLGVGVRMATINRGQDDEWFRMLASQNGAGYFDPSGQRITVNSFLCVQALEIIKKLCDADILSNGGWSEQIQNVKSSTVAGALYGAWYEGTIRTNAADQAGKWGVYRMPAQVPGGVRAANVGGSALAIPASSSKKQAAWDFVRFALATTGSQVGMLKEYGLVPGFLPALQDPYVHSGQKFWDDQPTWELVLGTLKDIPATRSSEYFSESRTIVGTLIGDFLDGRYPTAQACLDEAARQVSTATGMPVAEKRA